MDGVIKTASSKIHRWAIHTSLGEQNMSLLERFAVWSYAMLLQSKFMEIKGLAG